MYLSIHSPHLDSGHRLPHHHNYHTVKTNYYINKLHHVPKKCSHLWPMFPVSCTAVHTTIKLHSSFQCLFVFFLLHIKLLIK